ncbi:MAG: hypothetical protein IPJ82_05635 [Lewinellaceae bacterium]|nr:hypothetical protein [Lewinellaceae bacterium]
MSGKNAALPSLTAPADLTLVGCVQDQQDNQAAIIDWLDNYTVSDGCESEPTVTHDFSLQRSTLTVTWTATDDCGNSVTKTAKVLVVKDQNPPLLTAPADLTISCVQDQQNNTAAIIDWLDNYTVSDGCDSEPTVTHDFNSTLINYCTGNDLVVTWTATDDCGNSTTKSATRIEILKDATPPSLTAPADLTLSCVQDQQNNTAAIIDWLDNYTHRMAATPEPTVTHDFSATTIDYCTGEDIIVTWTATDDCGNSKSRTAKIVIEKDVTAPSLTAPEDITLSCSGNQQDNQATITDWLDNYIVSDGCDSEPTVTHDFSAGIIDYCTGDDITVTWTATDDCGNIKTRTALIVVKKT